MTPLPAKTLTALCAVGASIAIAACGDSAKPSDPLDNALQYLPQNAPFVAAISTDLDGEQAKALERIVRKFPFGTAAVGQLQKEIEKQAGDFDTLKELLGNDFVVGSTSAKDFVGTPSGEDEAWVGAIESKDAGKLEDQVKKEGKEDGEKDGATFYKSGDSEIAIQDGTLIVAGNRKQLEAAIERHGGDDHLTQDDFEKGTGDLPEDSVLQAYFNIAELLASDPSTARARKIKWVAALEGFGLGASAASDAINAEFNVTTKDGLSKEDLPLAAGSASPEVVARGGEIGVGVKGAGQIVTFAEDAGKAISPGGFAQYEKGKEQIEQATGVSLANDILAQLDGDLDVSISLGGKFGARADLTDPKAMEQTLTKLAKFVPEIAEGASGGKVGFAKRGPYYAIATAKGTTVLYGVVQDRLIVANDSKLARAIASAPASSVAGAKGSVAVKADAEELGDALLQQFTGTLGLGAALGGQLVTGPLGQLTGSIETSTSGLKGKLKLTFDD